MTLYLPTITPDIHSDTQMVLLDKIKEPQCEKVNQAGSMYLSTENFK